MIQSPQGRALIDDLHPSAPFPTKKLNKFETPLHLACRMGMKSLLLLFLQHGGNPNATNSNDETSLHCVCRGPGVPAAGVSFTSAQAAVRSEMLEIVLNWTSRAPDATGMSEPETETVSINHADCEGNSALHYAAAGGLLRCVSRLVMLDAIVSLVNKSQMTCCELADEGGHAQLAAGLELALLFQPGDAEMGEFGEVGGTDGEARTGILFLDSQSFLLNDVCELVDKRIQDTFL
jgi:ankyrin repeat protein